MIDSVLDGLAKNVFHEIFIELIRYFTRNSQVKVFWYSGKPGIYIQKIFTGIDRRTWRYSSKQCERAT